MPRLRQGAGVLVKGLWPIAIFATGQISQPALGKLGERFAAWAEGRTLGPHLQVTFRRQDPDGALWLDVENDGTKPSTVVQLKVCVNNKWFLTDPRLTNEKHPDAVIVFKSGKWDDIGDVTPNALEVRPDDTLNVWCSKQAIYGPPAENRTVKKGETKSLRFVTHSDSAKGLILPSFENPTSDSGAIGGGGECAMMLVANNARTNLTALCSWPREDEAAGKP
jgi:hypothetical protein